MGWPTLQWRPTSPWPDCSFEFNNKPTLIIFCHRTFPHANSNTEQLIVNVTVLIGTLVNIHTNVMKSTPAHRTSCLRTLKVHFNFNNKVINLASFTVTNIRISLYNLDYRVSTNCSVGGCVWQHLAGNHILYFHLNKTPATWKSSCILVRFTLQFSFAFPLCLFRPLWLSWKEVWTEKHVHTKVKLNLWK